MTLKEGIPLHKVISAHGKLHITQVKDITYQLAKILKYLHKNNILYRDLKLPNVLLTKAGQINLIDFGLSKILDSPNKTTKSVCGTPHCLPPEITEHDGEGYSFEIDFFGFGILAFELYLA